MIELIKFSIIRQIKNNMTLFLHIILIIFIITLTNADRLVGEMNDSSGETNEVYYTAAVEKYIPYLDDTGMIYWRRAESMEHDIILDYDGQWLIMSNYEIKPTLKTAIKNSLSSAIENSWLASMSEESNNEIAAVLYPSFREIIRFPNIINTNRQRLLTMMMTVLYFMMLFFGISNIHEIVYEKSSAMLEQILTAVSAQEYFFARLISAWISVMLQILLIGFELFIAIFMRNYSDQGVRLFRLLSNLNYVSKDVISFATWFRQLALNSSILPELGMSLLYLVQGMIIISLIVTVVSSQIHNVAEANILQTIVILLSMIYSFAAFMLNSIHGLSGGIGQILSLLPITSMLLMPMRILALGVNGYEVGLGIILNIVIVIALLILGAYIYKFGIHIDREKPSINDG